MKNRLSRRQILGGAMGVGAGIVFGKSVGWSGNLDSSNAHLLHTIDCTQEFPADRFFSDGETNVLETSAGRYREADGKPASRFGYRFSIENIGRPHVAVIRYPDDKRRFMCVMDGTSYDLTTGVFTGWAQPISGEMLELRQVFWPRWKDCSIVFQTWGEGEPAAVSEIEIHELKDLPELEVPGDPNDGSRRELGIQYEDPAGTGAAEGATTRKEWIDHLVQYAKHSGQKLLVYPMAWYHGPLFPSEGEPAGAFDVVTAQDRKSYIRWTTQPENWYASLLARFGEEGLEFQGGLTLMRLGSLLEKMNIDLESIQAGEETFNNMTWNDRVQGSTMDWTTLYNVRNFPKIQDLFKEKPFVEPYGGALQEWMYGETRDPSTHMAPMFNPLHPVVQEAILAFVGEIGRRYGKYTAFKGITFNMFSSCMPWFGSIHSGYDDYTVGLFEKETGIDVPVDAKLPDRFSRRYEFLTYVCRPAWVEWRCKKVRSLFGDIHRSLAEHRADLRVNITLWDETFVPGSLKGNPASHQIHARKTMHELYREAGIDVNLYSGEPGLEVDLALGNPRDRGGHGSNPTGGINTPLAEMTMYRDFDYLDQETLDAVHGLDQPSVFIFNCWVEAWGKHIWFPPQADDSNLPEIAMIDGKPAEGIFRINSEYKEDGFWWESQSRITPGFPGGIHFMEAYAHAIAELDATRITRGGLFLDKAHTDPIRRFARAYRALPKEKFTTVASSTDPVAVRELLRGTKRYFYLVNREYYPVAVEVNFGLPPKDLRDLASGGIVEVDQHWKVILNPYELRSFTVEASVQLSGFNAVPAQENSGGSQTTNSKGV